MGPSDILGNPIVAGCWVAYCQAGSVMTLFVAKVLKVTDKRVILDVKSSEWQPNLQRPFNGVVVIPDQGNAGMVV